MEIVVVITAGQLGFVSVSLHRSEDGTHVVNYLQWTDKERLAAAHHSPVQVGPFGTGVSHL